MDEVVTIFCHVAGNCRAGKTSDLDAESITEVTVVERLINILVRRQ